MNSPSNIVYYLVALGYGKYTSELLLRLIKEVKKYDDIALFLICRLLTDWVIPFTESSKIFVKEVEDELLLYFKETESYFNFYCFLWFSAKYGEPENLYLQIMKKKNIWINDDFLSRQVTSILPRIYPQKPKHIKGLLENLINKGSSDVKSVGVNIRHLMQLDRYHKGMNLYLFPNSKNQAYPLPKFLILYSLLNSEHFRDSADFKQKIKEYINDPWYKYWIKKYYDTIFK